MSLWWLSFKGGRIVIVRAETLVHARLLASTAVEGARAYLFDAGFQVDPEFEQMIPDGVIGRTLSRDEAIDLQRRLRGDAKYYKRPAAAIRQTSSTVRGIEAIAPARATNGKKVVRSCH
jgi:hypothetical protein